MQNTGLSFNKKNNLLTSKLELNLRNKLLKYTYGAENWTLRKIDQKYLNRVEMWCWRRIEKVIWTDRERNEVLKGDKVEGNILQTMKRRKDNWIGHISGRNCLQKRVLKERYSDG
jgi:hypothetical protein